MIKSGTRPTKPSHKDFDLHRTYGTVAPPTFPDELNFDAGLTMPNQNVDDTSFTPLVKALLYGCTEETTADLTTDITGVIHRPDTLEEIAHASARGGADVREILDTARKELGWFKWFFAVHAVNTDFFDAIRLAMMFGVPEKRTVSIGTPWYAAFEGTVKNADGTFTSGPVSIVGEPWDWSTKNVSWHNWAIVGWKTINGTPYLIGKSWQGRGFGDNGYIYFSRSIINKLYTIPGVCAFTVTEMDVNNIQTVSLSLWQTLLSYIRTYLSYSY